MMKRCTRCKQTKYLYDYTKNRTNDDGLQGWCRACMKANYKIRVQNYAVVQRRHQLRTKYGITLERYDAMHNEQSGLCAICGQPETGNTGPDHKVSRLAVDHDRETGQVRGLLCRQCNTAIGQLNHDVDRMATAIQYLERTA